MQAQANEDAVGPGAESIDYIDGIVARTGDRSGALLSVMEEVQDRAEFRYLSEASLRRIAERTGTPLSRVWSVATFYSLFNLKPQGAHTVVVCRGTACHTRGSRALLLGAAARLGVSDFREEEESSFTTADRLFTVRTVACFGQCALAPVVAVDGVIHSRMTEGKLAALISRIAKGGRK
jgi:NADH-quinone oxidoreductase subunit E